LECRKDLSADVSFSADTILLNNPSFTVTLASGSTVNANHFLTTSNSCSGYLTIQASNPALAAQVNVPSGVVNCSYLILSGIHAGGGATFNAISSVILSNVAGWNILSAPVATTYYWVGGTGNWSNGSHWSTSTGGPGGICIPTSLDNVIFDGNSFSSASDTLYLDLSSNYCNNMTWQSISGNPVVICNDPLSSNFSLLIYGSLALHPNVIWDYTGKLTFTGSGITKTLLSSGVLLNDIYFNGPSSTWSLLDSLHCEDLYLQNGYLKTYGHNLTADYFCSFDDSTRLGTSTVTTQYFLNTTTDPEFSGDSSHVDCSFFEGYGQHYNDVQLSNNFLAEYYGQNCFIRNFSAISDISFLGAVNNTFAHADFSGRANITGSHTFGTANFHGPTYLLGNNSFDTLLLNNAGDSLVLGADSTQTVNYDLFANASLVSPISFYSTIPGTQAFLPCNGNQVCLEYTDFIDIQSNGTAAFYAGNFSVNNGNNAGINFTACPPPSSNVWPGDANNDLITDNSDILNIGIAYNQTGYTRPGANISYTSQNCYDWSAGAFINLVNFNHADCDGNGIIDSTDVSAVYLNYGQSHVATIAPPPTGNIISPRSNYDLWLDPAINYYSPTDFVTIPVKLGTPTNQANSMYGVSYTITYDNTKIVNGSVYMTYPSTWFTPNGNRISFQLDNFAAGQIDDAQSRTDATTISGDGTIAYLHLQIAPSAFGTVPINISGITAVDQFGNPITLIPTGTILYIGPLSVAQHTIAPDVQLFPNPTNKNATLTYSLANSSAIAIDLFDTNGKCVYHESKPESSKGEYSVLIPMETLDAGVYFCRFTTGENVQTIKLVKTE
ncbi:MAG TPA: T9SS type A sorting domain-containing protein, partial [Bacteroidia bacterium]|nr:T9SS type A sorting domain-containing protein [Bacteroidia bacterium]